MIDVVDMEISIEENDIALDAAIQRFEFSFELFWKTLKTVLIEVGGIQINSPKQVLKGEGIKAR